MFFLHYNDNSYVKIDSKVKTIAPVNIVKLSSLIWESHSHKCAIKYIFMDSFLRTIRF